MFQTIIVETLETHILGLVTFFSKNQNFYEIIWEKYCRTGQATLYIRIACWI